MEGVDFLLILQASTPARVSAVNMQSRHSTPAFEAGGASPDTETAADMHHSPVQVRQLWEEVSRLRTSESRATQQAAQLRLQLDLLEAQKGGADSIESQQLQAKVARLRERNAELEAQLQGRFVPIQPSTNDEAAQALTKEAAEAEARRQQVGTLPLKRWLGEQGMLRVSLCLEQGMSTENLGLHFVASRMLMGC